MEIVQGDGVASERVEKMREKAAPLLRQQQRQTNQSDRMAGMFTYSWWSTDGFIESKIRQNESATRVGSRLVLTGTRMVHADSDRKPNLTSPRCGKCSD